jgi:GNAT superfamily N-acetyltransferase
MRMRRRPASRPPSRAGAAVARCIVLSDCPADARVRLLEQAESIFFETAPAKTFRTAAEKHAFLQRWFGNYVEAHPDAFLIALDEAGNAAGYLAGCPDSFAPASRVIIGGIDYFTPEFCAALKAYPSHFHINVTPSLQGKGIGHELVARFEEICARAGSPGIHVVTGEQSRAVDFYRRLGFHRMNPYAGCNPAIAVLVRAIAR